MRRIAPRGASVRWNGRCRVSLGEMRYGNELMWTVMYRFEVYANGASGFVLFIWSEGGVVEGAVSRGIGFGEGNLGKVVRSELYCAKIGFECDLPDRLVLRQFCLVGVLFRSLEAWRNWVATIFILLRLMFSGV
jgi:hypothetical protein